MTDTLLLTGVVGSTAYGLAGADSDVDVLGVYAAPTTVFHGLHPPTERTATKVSTDPDRTLHEAGKFARLCLSGNPTVTELLWLPEELYQVRTPLGEELIGIRTAFLSAPRVRDAYLGYATRQFRRLEARGDGSFSADTRKRVAKHARHLARLVHQGLELYRSGRLTVRLADPEWYLDFGARVAAGDLDVARALMARGEADYAAARTVLPERPDEDAVERWLLKVRAAHYTHPCCKGD
ncbi:nucleotidyltransferase domain-containing protein [Thermomonospora sp. CIF 1]|uniref:nucleotidyltransferase domain-containing protein n=1 Tax=Thermomonospora sp. CIF 1 TaxID=1916083 RepID=UPI000AA67E56|nr:nucleotidyltransferase domain-containing protein [Thermomonospora sp. CIF 1]PKK16255.1 MAG: nucleotidyltransferase [Thermomonospora sp. CIF 1]